MNDLKVKGIVLQSKDLKEKDKLVKIFTLENGIINAVLKGVKKNNSKLKFAKEPFCFADFYLSGKTDLKTVIGVDFIEGFYELPKDLDKFMIATSMVKSINGVILKEQADNLLFINFIKALKELNYSNTNSKIIFILFILNIFKHLGYQINFDKCVNCGSKFIGKKFINLETCEIKCSACRDVYSCEIENQTFSIMKIISNLDYDKLSTLKINEDALEKITNLLHKLMHTIFKVKINSVL